MMDSDDEVSNGKRKLRARCKKGEIVPEAVSSQRVTKKSLRTRTPKEKAPDAGLTEHETMTNNIQKKPLKKVRTSKASTSNDLDDLGVTDISSDVKENCKQPQKQNFQGKSNISSVNTLPNPFVSIDRMIDLGNKIEDSSASASSVAKLKNVNIINDKNVSNASVLSNSKNILHYLCCVTRGIDCSSKLKKARNGPIVRKVSNLIPYKMQSPFDRRVTAITWHPTNSKIVAIGSKGGDLSLYNTDDFTKGHFLPGIGAGGSVVALKFHSDSPSSVYTASITGRVMLQDFHGGRCEILLNTCTWENWFSSLDVSAEQKLLFAGDCKGGTYLRTLDGETVFNHKKMHKSKITHVEFCHKQPSLIATASIDHTVKLWDLRMIKSSALPLHTFKHEKAVTSAYFSLANGSSLLTTDQHSELRVYTGPLWDLKTLIRHPHRQFQHLTSIKASWYPLNDIVIVGRYPDTNFCATDRRTIDFFDGQNGDELYRLWSPKVPGIVSLNYFNCTGDTLASSFGFNIIFWKDEDVLGNPNTAHEHVATPHNPSHRCPRNRKQQGTRVMRTQHPSQQSPSTSNKRKITRKNN